MGPGKIQTSEILEQIDKLTNCGVLAEYPYYSLLQALLFPSSYTADPSALPLILDSLRKAEANLGAMKVHTLLNRLLCPDPMLDDF